LERTASEDSFKCAERRVPCVL